MSCIFHLQRILDSRFELVVVVDDPGLWPRIAAAFETRKSFMRVPTKLLRMNADYGYAIANNAGATAASGDVLFFMNSDMLVREPDPLIRAAAAIRDAARHRREVVAGFSLRFEDETVQHVGIAFKRSPSLHDLYLAEHPMKGLPPTFCDRSSTPAVQAVTGALLAMSQSLFEQLGGFDPAFERTDFEDADLCLRAVEAGAEIRVLNEPGLYHLEAQSRSHVASELRQMLTYLNCMEFNRRWAERLDRRPRVLKRKRQPSPAHLAAV